MCLYNDSTLAMRSVRFSSIPWAWFIKRGTLASVDDLQGEFKRFTRVSYQALKIAFQTCFHFLERGAEMSPILIRGRVY